MGARQIFFRVMESNLGSEPVELKSGLLFQTDARRWAKQHIAALGLSGSMVPIEDIEECSDGSLMIVVTGFLAREHVVTWEDYSN